MSTHPESVVNPLVAACEDGYVPTRVELLSNPEVESYLEPVEELISTVLTAYDRHDATVEISSLDHEMDLPAIIDHFKTPVVQRETNDRVAVDITPGRKFMTAIAFQAGMKYDADHVYYLHLDSEDYFGEVLSTIPRVAYELIDFRERIG
jgi:uncharacterized protein (DUF2461 family)